MTRRHLSSGWIRLASAALIALALGATTVPAHAFWGLLGKAAGGAGKTAGAAGTAGKAAGAGTAAAAGAGAATLVDDAARVGGKAAAADAAVAPAAGGAGHAVSAVNAALPPEVAVYLARPATVLTTTDTSHMMVLYHQMVAQAGKTGDFSVLERMPQVHGAKTLPPAAPPVPVPVKATATVPSPAGSTHTPSAVAEINLAALRLLVHAGSAGHRVAQQELRERCTDPAVLRTAPADVQAACKAAAKAPPPAKPRPAAT